MLPVKLRYKAKQAALRVAEAAVHLECLPKVFNAQDGDGQFLKNAEMIQLPYEASAICRERRLQAIEDHQAARRLRPEA